MTRNAWLMLVPVWSVILFFSVYFLWRVFTLPSHDGEVGQDPPP